MGKGNKSVESIKLVLKVLTLIFVGFLLIVSSVAIECVYKKDTTRAAVSLDTLSFTSEFTGYSNSEFTIGTITGLENLHKLVNEGYSYQKRIEDDKDGNPQNQTVTAQYDFSGKTIKFTKDIDLRGNFAPIGDNKHPFKGNVDGDYHTISGLNINSIDGANEGYADFGDGVGLFGNYEGSEIKNLKIVANTISSTGTSSKISPVGALVGVANSSLLKISNIDVVIDSIILNTTFRGYAGSYNVYHRQGDALCGGLVGVNKSNISINDCIVRIKNKMQAYSKYGFASCGGLVGVNDANKMTISNCVVSANYMEAISENQTNVFDADGRFPMYQYCSCLGGLCGMCTSSWASDGGVSYANPINATISSCYVMISNFTCSSNTGRELVQPMVAGSIGNVETGSWIDFGTHQWLIVTTTKCYYKANFTNVQDGSTYKSD